MMAQSKRSGGIAVLLATTPLVVAAQGPEAVEQQLKALVRQDFLSVVLGTVIVAAGLLAVTVHVLRRSGAGGRLLLWFGLFAGLYGLRQLFKTPLVWRLLDVEPGFWQLWVATIDFAIVIPAGLFFLEIYGSGWRGSARLMVWALAAYAPFAIFFGIFLGDPFAAPDPAVGLLILLPPLVAVGHVKGYRPPRIPDAPVLAAGVVIFILTVLNEHLVEAGWAPWAARFEWAGFFILTVCLGFVAVRRFVSNETQLLAVQQEMKAAARIQSTILPLSVPEIDGVGIAARYAPMAAVGGDFYGFLPVDGRRVGVLLADVMGHGVPAALVASMIRVCLSGQIGNAADPGRVISELNEMLCHQAPGNYCTAAYLFLDTERRSALYAAAGHPPLLVWRASAGGVFEREENGLMLGVRSSQRYPNLPIDLAAGDRLLLYTDGIIEAADSHDELFGFHRLKAFMESRGGLKAEAFADELLAEVARWSGGAGPGALQDDLTVATIDVLN